MSLASEIGPWCVFVSGSRDLEWKHEPLVREKLQPFLGPSATVIHGMGQGRKPTVPGADRVVARVAQDLGFHIIAIPALWVQQDKRAGPVRNHLCGRVLYEFGLHGYRSAFLGFSTGGAGTEGALAMVERIRDSERYPIQIERVKVTL